MSLQIAICLFACAPAAAPESAQVSLQVLGIAQDAGYPQAACQKACCKAVWDHPEDRRRVVSLGLTDSRQQTAWLFEATPDLPSQLTQLTHGSSTARLGGIFLTHAHIGHYTGLMYLGREAMGASRVPVYAMPRMATFLEQSGPWSQLVQLENIALQSLEADQAVELGENLQITPLLVPHRDEFSETVGYVIQGPRKSALFIPDIDKWERWDQSIEQWVRRVDYALLDATFFDGEELPGRNMAEIPHPFVVESMQQLGTLSEVEKARVIFLHFNHTNPLLNPSSEAYQAVQAAGFQIAEEGLRLAL